MKIALGLWLNDFTKGFVMNFGFNTCAKVALVAGAALFLPFGSAQAGLIGSSMNAKFITQGAGNPPVIRGEETFTIAPGLGLVDLGQGMHLTFSDTQITLTIDGGGNPVGTGGIFDGVVFTLLTGPEFTDVTIDPSSTPQLLGALFDFDADGLTFNIAASCTNFSCPDDAQLIFNITTATAVPEPASIAILGAGLAGLAALRRRRQR